MLQRVRAYLVPIGYLCMSWQFLRYYVSVPHFFLNFTDYLNGTERLPYQYRILPVLFLKPLGSSTIIKRIAASRSGALHDPDVLCQFLLAGISLAFIYFLTIRLYRAVSTNRRFEFIVYPILIFILLWTYCIHIEHDYSYPYDLPPLAFFTAGITFIYEKRFLPLLLIVLVGTFNRETTLFLAGIYLIDCAFIERTGRFAVGKMRGKDSPAGAGLGEWTRRHFDFNSFPWLRTVLLLAVWAAIKALLTYKFRFNDSSEYRTRLLYNLVRIASPNEWPVALNVGGYVLPFVLVFSGYVPNRRVVAYFLILIPWLMVMFTTGVLIETRIYGEFSILTAVVATLLIERYAESSNQNASGSLAHSERLAG